MASGAPDWWIQGIIPMSWLNLSDTPGDFVGRAGLVPEVNAGEDALAFSAAKIDAHASRHQVGGSDAMTALYTDAAARAAINDIFGSDGKADKDIDFDTNILLSGRTRLGQQVVVNDGQITQNAYYDDPNWKYIANGYALMITMEDDTGKVIIKTAPSGSADGTITFTARFTLDDSGNLTDVVTYDGIDLSKSFTIHPAAYKPTRATHVFALAGGELDNLSTLNAQTFMANVKMPHGKTVNALALFGFRDDASATLQLTLHRSDLFGNTALMGDISATWTDGYNGGTDSSINNAVIDTESYVYYSVINIDPNDAVGDVRFCAARVGFA